MTCFPHVSRKVREARSRLRESEFYEGTIEPHVKLMHMCRTREQFQALSKLALKIWRYAGEDAYRSSAKLRRTLNAPQWALQNFERP